MEQELKPIDNSFFGGRRSWRDEARLRLQQALGETGERLGEGLLGESEEEKYLEFLQRTYGSELPRDEEGNIDVPASRPIGDAFTDMSDIGAADKILMMLSAGSSVSPKLAATAAGVETGALLGDAEGEYRKGNTLGSGIMAATAALPFGINRLMREVTRNRTKNTPLLPDLSRRQFTKGLGAGIATLGVMASPLGVLLRNTGKVMAKLEPTKFLNKTKEFYTDIIRGPDYERYPDLYSNVYDLPEEITSASVPPVKRVKASPSQYGGSVAPDEVFEVNAKSHRIDDYDIQAKENALENKHFEDHGFSTDDIMVLDDDTTPSALNALIENLTPDPNSIKRYNFRTEDGKLALEEVTTFTVDGVPVSQTFLSDPHVGGFGTYRVPKKHALLEKAQ